MPIDEIRENFETKLKHLINEGTKNEFVDFLRYPQNTPNRLIVLQDKLLECDQ